MDTKTAFLCVSDLMRSFSTASNNQCIDYAVLTQHNQQIAQNLCYKTAFQRLLEITWYQVPASESLPVSHLA